MIDLRLGDCIEVMKEMPDESVHAVVTDPPYGIGFMGREWDMFDPQHIAEEMAKDKRPKTGIASQRVSNTAGTYDQSISGHRRFQNWVDGWAEQCLRVLKTGGFLFSFGGTRTHHRLTCGIEDAGFKIRDEFQWVYFTGFPKAQDLGMLIEKKLGGKGEVVGKKEIDKGIQGGSMHAGRPQNKVIVDLKVPSKEEAKRWVGWKTPALKPACEPIVVAQKPCVGSITENVLKHGVGGFNIDACRIPFSEKGEDNRLVGKGKWYSQAENKIYGKYDSVEKISNVSGRFPANCILTDEVFGDKSKFFLIPKAGKTEKNTFTYGMSEKAKPLIGEFKHNQGNKTPKSSPTARANFHPTVKPVELMKHLIKLCTRENQTVLDPFLGSGTTGIACKELNRSFIGIEQNKEYLEIAKARLNVGRDLNSFLKKN